MLKKSRKVLSMLMAMLNVRPVADVYKDVPEDVQYPEELDAEGNKVCLFRRQKKSTSMV